MTPHGRPMLLLIGICGVLSLYVVKQAGDLSSFTEPPPLQIGESEAPLETWQPPEQAAIGAYDEMLAHPPFDPQRGAVTAAPEPAPVRIASPVKPVAIVIFDETKLVLLEVEGASRPVRAKLGDRVAGWRVIGIAPKEVVLEDADGRLDIIRVQPPKPAPRQSTPLQSAGPAPEKNNGGTVEGPQLAAPQIEAAKKGDDSIDLTGGESISAAPPTGNLPVWTPESLKRLVQQEPQSGSAQ